MFGTTVVRKLSFFGDKLSRVAGQVCCEYGQNGKPLATEYVQEFLATAAEPVQFWQANADYTMLQHSWFFTNYLQALAFAMQVGRLDSNNVLKQVPSVHIFRKELLRLELTTPKLGGLSYADLALAVQISLIPAKEYGLVPIKDEKHFRRELRMKMLHANQPAE